MIVITLFFLIQSYLQIGQCSSCKLKNTENNLLTMTIGETFRLPLSTYFQGEGLTFELSQDSGFEVSNHTWGPGETIGNIISITSLSVNNNPYIQSFQYFALIQLSLGSEYYFIYASSMYQENLYNVSFQNQIANITFQFCGAINTISQLIVVTCLFNSTLNYFVYNIQGELQNTFTIPMINIPSDSTQIFIESQASNQYTVQIIDIEYIGNFLYAFQFNGTTQPNLLFYLVDYVSGFSLEGNLLFLSLYDQFTNFQIYDLSLQNSNPIITYNLSMLSLMCTYNLDSPSNYYYIVLDQGYAIVTAIYDVESNFIFYPKQIFENNNNYIYEFMDAFVNEKYIVLVSEIGIYVYPSIFDDVNEGTLLFFFPQNYSIVSAFDQYNNFLISITDQGVFTFQLYDTLLITRQSTLTFLPLAENTKQFTITASTNNYNQNSTSCPVLTLYYQVVSYPDGINTTIYQTSQYVSTPNNILYDQIGQQFNINFGSALIININKILIGAALFIQSPLVQPAISNQIDTQYSTILKPPQIKSQYKVNSNLFDGQKALFSQLFYDPTTLTITNANSQFSDSYYQLIQYDQEIVLLQCQGIKDSPCQVIIQIPEKDKLVQQFALSVNNGQINLAYYYNEVNVGARAIGKMTVFSVYLDDLSPTGYSNYNNTFNITKKEILQELYVNQIAMLGADLYVLYSATSGVKKSETYTYIQIANATQLAQGMSIEDGYQFQLPDQYFINEMYYDVISYGKLIFLQTQVGNSFYISIINYNYNQAQIVSQIPLTFNGVPVQGNDYYVFYGLSMDGIYIVDANPQPIQLYFIPRVDLLSIVYQSQQQTNPINLDINPIQLPLFNVSSVKRAYGSARFFYIMAKETNSYSYSIYVYRNSPTVLNSLYYIIRAEENSVIYEESFSVISALQYDAIIFRSEGGNFYTSGYLLPELEIQVSCNLNSNSQYQVTYNYLGFKANSLLFGTTMPSTTQQLWVSFQITNLISFVQEKSTLASTQVNGQPITLNANGQAFIDPRTFFTGNIQTFTLTNSTLASGYYFNMIPTVVSQPQISVFQNPVTAVSAMVSFNVNGQAKDGQEIYSDASYQNQYWCTFVQTNHIVYVTPYMFYNPSSPAFVDNSTVLIDYPLTYKLPILDPSPNSQNCPLIFVDQLSQGIVSVCGTKSGAKFLVSFTIFNPYTQLIQETQIINITNAFTINLQNNDGNAKYFLQSASYLEIGVVILQFRYTYNLGQNPPTDIILPFVYAANLAKPTVTNLNGQPSYQMIQPIDAVSYIQHQDLANLFIISPFSVSTQFMGGLPTASDASMMFGLLCVSNSNEECLVTSSNSVSSSGVVVTVPFSTTIGEFLNGSGNITVLPATFSTQTHNNVYGPLNFSVFDVSIINALSDYTINSIQQIVQAGTPMVYEFVYSVPFVVVSQGTAYVTKLSFYQANGQFITTKYSCTLAGLTNQNKILQVSTGGYGTTYQVVAVVSNPKTNDINQVTLLNYGIINEWCKGLTSLDGQTTSEVMVTAIGSYTYQSIESTPVLSLMFPSPLPETNIDQLSNIPRTLISNNKVIQLLDTNPKLILTAYPDYNVNQGVTLSNTTGTISTEGIQTQITAQPIEIYINNNLLNGATGSSLFTFQSTTPPDLADKVWFHKITGQFIWGSIMFAIIAGVITFLFYKSQPLPYDYA